MTILIAGSLAMWNERFCSFIPVLYNKISRFTCVRLVVRRCVDQLQFELGRRHFATLARQLY